jgi:hypothetical protein
MRAPEVRLLLPDSQPMAQILARSTPYVLLVSIAVTGFFLRMQGLAGLGLGFDETMHIYGAKAILEAGRPLLPSGMEYTRSLPYTYAVALAFKWFGISEMSARFPSVVAGTLSILLTYVLARHVFGAAAGWVAALLVAFLPFQIVFSRMCRMYSMYQLAFLTCCYAFIRGFERGATGPVNPSWTAKRGPGRKIINWYRALDIDSKWLLLAGLTGYLAFRLHDLALLFGVTIMVYLIGMTLYCHSTGPSREWISDKYFIVLSILTVSLVIMLMIPSVFEHVNIHVHFEPYWGKAREHALTAYYNFMTSPTLYAVLVFFAIGLGVMVSNMSSARWYLLCCALVPLCYHSIFSKRQQFRYIFDIFPIIVSICAFALTWTVRTQRNDLYEFTRKITRRHAQSAVRTMAMVAIVGAVGLLFYPAVRDAMRIDRISAASLGGQFHAEWREACSYVNGAQREGDVVIASVPLAAEFSGCEAVEYSLDNGEIEQFIEVPGERFRRHAFARAKAIEDLDGLLAVMEDHPRGWLIMDTQRFLGAKTVPPAVRDFVRERLIPHRAARDATVLIFQWDRQALRENAAQSPPRVPGTGRVGEGSQACGEGLPRNDIVSVLGASPRTPQAMAADRDDHE